MMEKKTCLECKVEFKPKNSKAVFCSGRCRQKSYRNNLMQVVRAARGIKSTISEPPRQSNAKIPSTDNKYNDNWVRKPVMKVPPGLKGVARSIWIANWKKENK